MTQDTANKQELTAHTKRVLLDLGANLVGVGSLTELPPKERSGMPVGVSVAVTYPSEVIRGIAELPTPEYLSWYLLLNERLDNIVTQGAIFLQEQGYQALAQTRATVGSGEAEDSTVLPHKTVATRAGMGWIGKSALLVTKEYGSMIRLSSILTDAPLITAKPVNRSWCGNCAVCTNACPGSAISGKEWEPGLYRDEFFDPVKCRETAQERSMKGFGGVHTICGKCIEMCPHTRRVWTLPN